MANGKWRFRMLSLLLLAVVLADGALTGAAFAIARYANDPGSVAVSSFETQNGNGEFFQQADSADGQQVASQEHVSQGYASQDHATQNHVSQEDIKCIEAGRRYGDTDGLRVLFPGFGE